MNKEPEVANNPVPDVVQNVMPGTACNGLTVMFDGSCPLCRREIGLYQSLKAVTPVTWCDVSADASLSERDKSLLMARFHVRKPSGELLSGAAAFVALWKAMPGWRWVGFVAGLPGVTPMLECVYLAFLKVRPLLQRLAA